VTTEQITRKVLRTNDLIKVLNVSRATIYRWERAGLIPAKRRLGPNTVGWLESEIDQWLASKAPAGGGDPEQGSGERP